MALGEKRDWRFTFIVMLFFSAALGILGRLFFLQITKSEFYRTRAEVQQTAFKIKIPHRGSIFFEDKAGRLTPAAITKTTYALYINPAVIKDPAAAFARISDAAPVSREEFMAKMSDTGIGSRILARGIGKDTAAKIADQAPDGIYLGEEDTRVYPGGVLASQVLGFVGFSGDFKVGRYGVEESYERVLAGLPANASASAGASAKAGGFLFSLSALKQKLLNASDDGADIVLSIDPNLEAFIEKRMALARERWHATAAGALVMEPKTGKILAMGSVPTFDPNAYGKEKNYDVFINPFVQKIFEMGSVFKPLTMAAALDAHVLTPETTYVDEGKLTIDGRTIENFDGKGHGVQTMTQVLEQSLNTGAVFAMRRLGGPNLRKYFEAYGLGDPTGIDLPDEIKGNLRNLASNREIEFATASFGQGVAVTPIELASALASLANQGEAPRPYVVSRVVRGNEVVQATQPRMRGRAITPATSETISRMLTLVVDNTLAGGTVKMPAYSIAAKTGTAQISNKGGRGYSNDYLHTYFGYAPSFDPRFLILLYLEKPQGVKYSSQSLTDSFKDIVRFLISYYEIPPDRAPTTANTVSH